MRFTNLRCFGALVACKYACSGYRVALPRTPRLCRPTLRRLRDLIPSKSKQWRTRLASKETVDLLPSFFRCLFRICAA
jgi:hypothetical protein